MIINLPKSAIVFFGICFGATFLSLGAYINRTHMEDTYVSVEVLEQLLAEDAYVEVDYETWNSGYRSGKMDVLAEMVECDNVKDEVVIGKYNDVSELLESWGELDNNPYPCAE